MQDTWGSLPTVDDTDLVVLVQYEDPTESPYQAKGVIRQQDQVRFSVAAERMGAGVPCYSYCPSHAHVIGCGHRCSTGGRP